MGEPLKRVSPIFLGCHPSQLCLQMMNGRTPHRQDCFGSTASDMRRTDQVWQAQKLLIHHRLFLKDIQGSPCQLLTLQGHFQSFSIHQWTASGVDQKRIRSKQREALCIDHVMGL